MLLVNRMIREKFHVVDYVNARTSREVRNVFCICGLTLRSPDAQSAAAFWAVGVKRCVSRVSIIEEKVTRILTTIFFIYVTC